jgi:DNA repair protein RecO (recombination protein O)
MIEKIEAIVLRVTPYSKTSHVVTWLTPKHGRLVTIVKGANRPKSAFLGQYDLFYTCELLYYARETSGIHIARECAPLLVRERLRSDWKASACAAYICDLISMTTFKGGHEPQLYELACISLDFLCEHPPKPQFLSWFELHMADVLGLAPQFAKCVICDGPLPDLKTLSFSSGKGGIACPRCAERAAPAVKVSPDTIAMLRRWQKAASPRLAQNTKCTAGQIASAGNILGIFLRYHLEMEYIPASRKVAAEMATLSKSL